VQFNRDLIQHQLRFMGIRRQHPHPRHFVPLRAAKFLAVNADLIAPFRRTAVIHPLPKRLLKRLSMCSGRRCSINEKSP
jgi:hypothetical protein